jgi:hypothetical protein
VDASAAIDELSPKRAMLWGTLAGATLPVLAVVSQSASGAFGVSPTELTAVAGSGVFGAISAVGSLSMAKNVAPTAEREATHEASPTAR